MKKNLLLLMMFLSVSALSCRIISAQITINIPKLPKIKKDKPSSPPKVSEETTTPKDTPTNGNSTDSRPQNERQPEPSAQNQDKYADNPGINFHIDEIKRWRKMVDEYDSVDKIYLVPDSNDNYLLYAVSPQAREKWLKNMGVLDIRQTPNNRLDAALDELKSSAAKKLPLYLPEIKNYSIRNPVEERLMKAKIDNPAAHKILYLGLQHANWQIDKNDLGIPTARYKRGMVWTQVAGQDHPYCWVYYINVIQDYAGGGTYGASYGNFIRAELFGCPAAGK